MSLWQMAQAAVLISTSPGPGSASSTVSTVKGLPKARQTAAFVFIRQVSAEGDNSDEAAQSRAQVESSSAVLRGRAIIFVGQGRALERQAAYGRGRSALPAQSHEIKACGSGTDPVFSKGWAPKPVQFATLSWAGYLEIEQIQFIHSDAVRYTLTCRSTGLCEQGIFLVAEV